MQSKTDEFSILNPGSREFVPLESVPFYQDLNLDQVINRMSIRWGKDMKKYFRYLPTSPEEVKYRRDIYRDFCGYLNEKYKEERSVIYDRFLPEICGSDEYAFDRFFTELEQYLSSRRTSS